MAWNIPGKNNDDRGSGRDGGGNDRRQNPWPPRRSGGGRGRGGGPFDGILDQLRRMFGSGPGGGSPLRWIGQTTLRASGAFAPVMIRQGALNNAGKFLQVEWLGKIFEGATFSRLHRHHEGAVGAHHDDAQLRPQLADARHTSKHAIVLQAVEDYMNTVTKTEKVLQSVERTLVRDAELLARLEDA